ncbi:conserved hypothetical protein [Talaromyces stipitatus ATCC 10500]|uniref:Uncharacterized protein n=1 Tax=Talaromyces stipitatus (strain ATCC 10500 / CBS 375.48 / QM 6759 / NRRL 1006) TaxID=441959 RepID=B8MIT0_TALSN|nr:uncharacterized protein TSTA_050310 [Talaromyces stipitatus ATCC 10500]EED15592.1 conserved hypothetical protein [Talaromyces stipitatus ATCC 10500]
MQDYRAIVLLTLVLHGLSVYANPWLASNLDLPLRLRRSDRPLIQRRTSIDLASHDNDTEIKSNIVSIPTEKLFARAEAAAVPTFDEAAFNQSVMTACTSAVDSYVEANNPSGMVACYNIAIFDNATGVFQTDVRLYQKSTPTGSFEGLTPADIKMSFSIPQATVSKPMLMVSNGTVTADTTAAGQFVMGFQNIGQLSKSLIFSKLSVGDLRILMIPTISLGANLQSGGVVNTTLSSDTLSYVAGVLVEDNGTPTNITAPQALSLASPIVASASVFVLPGTTIKIAPVGLIVTCIWSGLLMLAVGAGTVGRYQFRVHYRQRLQRATAINKTIPWSN